jgi:hypothetical protein
MQGATAGAVYGEVTFRTRIPESVRREVRKCRNEPNFFDSRLLSDSCKTVSLLLVGFRGIQALDRHNYLIQSVRSNIGTVDRSSLGRESV